MEDKYDYIDIHTHLNLEQFSDDWREAGERTLAAGVALINVGTDVATSRRAVEIAHAFEGGVYATVGTHPTESAEMDAPVVTDELRELAKDEKVVAIGECGLDYFRADKSSKEKQVAAFIEQIQLANELGKPLMLHMRPSEGSMDAYEDGLDILREHAQVRGNAHFFAGTLDIAKRFWEIDFTTSFTGVITFADQYDAVIKHAPIEMLHGETDAPYVAPVPYRGKRNEPLYVQEVYKRIAELRGEDAEVVRKQLRENATRMFGI